MTNMTVDKLNETPEELKKFRNTVFQRTLNKSQERLDEVIEGKKFNTVHLQGNEDQRRENTMSANRRKIIMKHLN